MKNDEYLSIKVLKDRKYQIATMYINRELQESTIENLVFELGKDPGFHQPIIVSSALNFIESGLPFSWKGKAIRSLDDLDNEGRNLAENDKLLVTIDGHHRQKAVDEYCRRNRKQRRLLDEKVTYRIRWNLKGEDLKGAWNSVTNIKAIPSSKDNLQQVIQLYYGEPWIEFDRAVLNLLNAGIPEQAAMHLVSYGRWGYGNHKQYLGNNNLINILTYGKDVKDKDSLSADGFYKSMVLMSLLESRVDKDVNLVKNLQTNTNAFLTKLFQLQSGGGFINSIDQTKYYCTPLTSWERLIDFANIMLTKQNIWEYYDIKSHVEGEDTTGTFRRGMFLISLVEKYINLERTKEDIEDSVRIATNLLDSKQKDISNFYDELNIQINTGKISRKIYTDRIYEKFKRGNKAITERLQHQYYLFTTGQ